MSSSVIDLAIGHASMCAVEWHGHCARRRQRPVRLVAFVGLELGSPASTVLVAAAISTSVQSSGRARDMTMDSHAYEANAMPTRLVNDAPSATSPIRITTGQT